MVLSSLGILFVLLLSLLYALSDLWLWWGLHKLSRTKKTTSPSVWPKITVLIAARNEEKNLPQLLQSLALQNYAGPWEIWIADDRSTDSTPTILESWKTQIAAPLHILRVEQCPHNISPKKHALQQIASQAAGEIFLLTDADCQVPPQWITGMVAQFSDTVEWVSGYSYFPFDPAHSVGLDGLQGLDFLSHRTIDAAGVGLQFPITACGQNLAYRKSTFQELNGFLDIQNIISGDDDLLMHKLAKVRPSAIHYALDPQTFVASQGASTYQQAWEQRKRWASKTTHYNFSTVLFLSAIFLYYNFIFWGLGIGFILYFTQHSSLLLYIALLAWLWKSSWDALVMAKGMQIFKQQHLWKFFLPTALLHIPVILGAVFWGLGGRFRWK